MTNPEKYSPLYESFIAWQDNGERLYQCTIHLFDIKREEGGSDGLENLILGTNTSVQAGNLAMKLHEFDPTKFATVLFFDKFLMNYTREELHNIPNGLLESIKSIALYEISKLKGQEIRNHDYTVRSVEFAGYRSHDSQPMGIAIREKRCISDGEFVYNIVVEERCGNG